MAHVPELFRRAQYADYDQPRMLALIKGITLEDIGVGKGEHDEDSQ
jgi:hypothetical protein